MYVIFKLRKQITPFEEERGVQETKKIVDMSHSLGPAHDGYRGEDQWEPSSRKGAYIPHCISGFPWNGPRGHTMAVINIH